jgi:hypothetical protein
MATLDSARIDAPAAAANLNLGLENEDLDMVTTSCRSGVRVFTRCQEAASQYNRWSVGGERPGLLAE